MPVPGVVETAALSQKKNSAFHAHCPTHWVESMMDQHCTAVVVTSPPLPLVVGTVARVVLPVTGALSQKENSVLHAQRPTHSVESMIDQHCCCVVEPPPGIVPVVTEIIAVVAGVPCLVVEATPALSQKEKSVLQAQRPTHSVESMMAQHCC